jgi:hypothetical protein
MCAKGSFVDEYRHIAARLGHTLNLGTRPPLVPLLFYDRDEGLSDAREVHDARLGHPKAARLEASGSSSRSSSGPIFSTLRPFSSPRSWRLLRSSSSSDSAATMTLSQMSYSIRRSRRLDDCFPPFPREAGLEASGLVVDAAVYNPVEPGLVPCLGQLFL